MHAPQGDWQFSNSTSRWSRTRTASGWCGHTLKAQSRQAIYICCTISCSPNIPFHVLDAHLFARFLVVVKPLALLQVDAWEDCRRLQTICLPLSLKQKSDSMKNQFNRFLIGFTLLAVVSCKSNEQKPAEPEAPASASDLMKEEPPYDATKINHIHIPFFHLDHRC